VIVYSAVASACEKAAEWQQALQLLDELEGVQLEIDVVMQNIATCTGKRDVNVDHRKHPRMSLT
jgi:hypothetical protein